MSSWKCVDYDQSALPSVSLYQICLFIYLSKIKIHFRFVRHWLWLNRVTAAFPPECLFFLKKEQNWSFICCMTGDDLTRWTEAPATIFLSLRLLIFYRWAAAISDICRSAPALPAPPTRGGFLCSRQINTICWWPDVHQRLPASEPVLGWGGGVE